MKRQRSLAAMLAALLLTAACASAGYGVSAGYGGSSNWVYGDRFGVGGYHFKVGYESRSRYRGYTQPRYRPDYYFYVRRPISYRGYSCGRFCFRRGGNHYYHHAGCPLLNHHFRRYGYRPSVMLQRYAP